MPIVNGNCIDGMKQLATDSVDLIVTDPPYGMSFMGKNWDKALPDPEAFRQMLRVLKPGAFAFVMCAPRSDLQARMSILLEDAGFDIAFTPIYWTFATGFPKAQNISKQIDKRGANKKKPEYPELAAYLKKARLDKGLSQMEVSKHFPSKTGKVTGRVSNFEKGTNVPTIDQWDKLKELLDLDNSFDWLIYKRGPKYEAAKREVIGERKGAGTRGKTFTSLDNKVDITTDSTPEAQQYNGSYAGFQPKPAVEVVIVAMKPKTEKTYVDQVLSNGKGITWLDDCRIPFKDGSDKSGVMNGNDERSNFVGYTYGLKDYKDKRKRGHGNSEGRFPANLLVSDDILNDHSKFFDLDAWFAIIPKAAKSEKNKGCEDLPQKIANPNYGSGGFKRPTDEPERQIKPIGNHHPTVKPIKLMSYLITLGSRPDEIVLDPFMGSGTTGISAKLTGRNFIGFEMEEEYFQIAEARINAWETTTIGQNKEDGCKDKEDGKSQPDGTRTGQTTLTSN